MASCSKSLLAKVLFLQANGQQTTVSVEPCCWSERRPKNNGSELFEITLPVFWNNNWVCWAVDGYDENGLQLESFFLVPCRVFNKGRQPAKLVSYSTWTPRLFDWEITSYFMTNMRNIRHKTRVLDWPRFIHEKQKNLFKCPNSCSR